MIALYRKYDIDTPLAYLWGSDYGTGLHCHRISLALVYLLDKDMLLVYQPIVGQVMGGCHEESPSLCLTIANFMYRFACSSLYNIHMTI